MEFFDLNTDREPQIELSELLQRVKGDTFPRTFGAFTLTGPTAQSLELSKNGVSMRMTKAEYLVMWACMSVSHGRDAISGTISIHEMDALLTGIIRESRKDKKTSQQKTRLPDAWKDDELSKDAGTVTRTLIQRLRSKLSETFGEELQIRNDDNNMGYYLTLGKSPDKTDV